MGNNISRQWYGSTTASLWCGMYVAPESYHNSCPINVAISSICASNTTRSQKWPPEIFAQISNFRILLLYEYIDCSCNVRTDATAVVTAGRSCLLEWTIKSYFFLCAWYEIETFIHKMKHSSETICSNV